MKEKIKHILENIKKSYFTSTAGIICIVAGVYIGVFSRDWQTASIAISAGTGLLFSQDIPPTQNTLV